MSIVAKEITFEMRVSPPAVKVSVPDRQAEDYARRNAKSAMESLARLYPQEFIEVVNKILLTTKRD